MIPLPSIFLNLPSRMPVRIPLRALLLLLLLGPLLATGCSKVHKEDMPGSPEAKRKKMGELTDELRQLKTERDKLDEKLKEAEHSYEQIRTSSLTATLGYVLPKTLTREVQQPGFTMSYETTPIYSYILGEVEKIGECHGQFYDRQVDMGDRVKKGEVLAVLYVPEKVEDVLKKKAMVFQTRAELRQAKEMLETAKLNVKTTEAEVAEEISVRPRIEAKYLRWQSEYVRIQKLYKDQVVDKQIMDETFHQYKGAEGEKGEVEAKIRKAQAANLESLSKKARAEADVDVAESRIEVALAAQREAQRWLDYREIRAPFDGKLTQRDVHTGHMVPAGATGNPLFTIIREDRMRVFVDVPEADAVYIKPGDPARIRIQAQEYQNRGDILTTVTRISDALNQTTRTLRVEFELENAKYNLLPGMYAYAYIPIVYKDVWTLPEAAIVQKEEQGSFVFRDVKGIAVFTPVKLGVRAGKEVQLLKYREKPASGADDGWRDFTGREKIIMNPVGFVDGVKIEQFETAHPG